MFTFVKDDLAMLAKESLSTLAFVASRQIFARPSVNARSSNTLIHILFTVYPLIARLTLASVTAIVIDTGGAILTRFACFTWIKSCISTVTKPTHWCPDKFIHEKIGALLYLDVGMPMAAASTPMEAHFAVDNLSDVCWMGSA